MVCACQSYGCSPALIIREIKEPKTALKHGIQEGTKILKVTWKEDGKDEPEYTEEPYEMENKLKTQSQKIISVTIGIFQPTS